MKPTTFIFFMLLSTALWFSCKKGDTGAAGPKGDTGAPGPTGPTGPKGTTGTANVMYSDWFTPNTYTVSTTFGTKHFSYDKAVPQITQEILDKGSVLVYARLEGYAESLWPSGQVGKLPVVLTYQSGGPQIDTWSAFSTAGHLHIDFTNSTNIYSAIATDHSFRYVIIPGGVAASAVAASLPHLSYKALCDLYQIPR